MLSDGVSEIRAFGAVLDDRYPRFQIESATSSKSFENENKQQHWETHGHFSLSLLHTDTHRHKQHKNHRQQHPKNEPIEDHSRPNSPDSGQLQIYECEFHEFW